MKNTRHKETGRHFQVLLTVGLLLSGLAMAPLTRTHAQPGGQPASPQGASSSPQFGHIVIVVGENTNASDAESGLPWLDALAAQYAMATQYYANTHPSIGNYLMMTTGQILTNDDAQTPSSFPVSVDNVVRELVASGKTWKAYQENIPSVGYIGGDSGNYAVRHDPLAYLTDVQNSATQRNNLVPFTQFATDLASGQLPNYSFITPNLCNDAHDCSITTFDDWLKQNIASLLTNSQFLQDGLLVITWDESADDNTNGGGRVQLVLAGPTVKKHYQSTTLYQIQSLLRLSLEGLGVTTWPGAAATAPAMSEFFTTTPPSSGPAISLSPTSLNFGNQSVGASSAPQTMRLTNSGGSALAISSIMMTGANNLDFLQTNNCGSSVAAGAICTLNVTFAPSAAGSETATLQIIDDAAGSPHLASLSGTGTEPAVSLSATNLAFGTLPQGTASGIQAITLSNVGNASLSIKTAGITLSGTNAGDFSIAASSTCSAGGTVAAGSSCRLDITFKPSTVGSESATLNIADNVVSSPQNVGLSGTGSTPSPIMTVTPASLNFANQAQGTTSSVLTVALKNTGSATATIINIKLTGANVADFVFAASSTCPTGGGTLAANASCHIDVTFKPSTLTAESASIAITDTAPNSPQIVALTGTTPGATLSPASLAFSSQTVGTSSTAKIASLSNPGSGALIINSLTLIGANVGDFSETDNCDASVSAFATCTISVTFKPTAAGSRSATLNITDNAAGSPHAVLLSGTGTTAVPTPVAVSIVPASASVAVGNTQPFTATVTNTSNTAVTWTLSGAGTLSPAGLYTAPTQLPSNTTATVTAASVADPTKIATATITIISQPTPGTAVQIPTQFFGMHIILGNYPTVSIGALRSSGVSWPTIEMSRGVFDWTALDSQVAVAQSHGLPFYYATDGVPSWTTSANTADFATFAAALVSRYKGKIEVYELWNEPDQDAQLASMTNTVALTKAFHDAVRTGDPAALIASPAATGDMSWYDGYWSAGGVTDIDVVAFHGYLSGTNPEELDAQLVTPLRTILANYGLTSKPVWDSEGSWGGPNTLTDLQAEAAFVARFYLLHRSLGISRFYWYSWDDNGNGPGGVGWGSLFNPNTKIVLPAAIAYQQVYNWMVGNTMTPNCAATNGVWSCGFQNGTKAVWAPGGSQSYNASGFGQFKDVGGNTHSISGGVVSVGAAPILLTFAGSPPPVPAASISTSNLGFSNQVLNASSSPQTVTLSNSGSSSLTITSIAVTGTNSGDFSQTNTCGASLPVGANCAIRVTFKPLAIGARSASVSVTDNASGSPQTISLTGTGTASSAAQISPGNLTFGEQFPGSTSLPQDLTLSNSSTGPLTITSVVITGTNRDEFTQTNNCGSRINAGGSCTISVTFKPSATNSRSATLIINTNAIGSPLSVDLVGTGASFSFSVGARASSSQTVTAGQTATYSLLVAGVNGFNGQVTLQCSGAPTTASCNVKPSTVSLNGPNVAAFAVTVATTAASLTGHRPTALRKPPLGELPVQVLSLLCLAGLAALWILGEQRGKKLPLMAPMALVLLASTLMVGCVGLTQSKTPTGTSTGTMAGTYTLTITASAASGASTSQTTTLTLAVK